MDCVTNALVLRSVEYREADCILTLFTQEMGKITASARGCRRKASPLAAGCQLLCWSEMELGERSGRWTVRSAATQREFHGVRLDLEKFALACYFSELTQLLALEGEPFPELLSLLLNCLHALDRMDRPPDQVKAVFELRSMCLAGFEPMLEGCSICGEEVPEKLRFYLREGTFRCARCAVPAEDTMVLDEETLTAIRYIAWCEPKRLLSFHIAGGALARLERFTERYLIIQMERSFRTLDYYHQVHWQEPPEEK